MDKMSTDLIKVSSSANEALAGLELPEDGPQAIRFYFPGFG
jgi:hypothetical protein